MEFLCGDTHLSERVMAITATTNVLGVVMLASKWDLDETTDNDGGDLPSRESPEVFADQFGIRTALLVLCIASFIAAIWFVSRPSFDKCSAIETVTARNACYDGLRKELLKPPAKGADIPKG
jgi:hypothetical protein